jgi:hypothetical protein
MKRIKPGMVPAGCGVQPVYVANPEPLPSSGPRGAAKRTCASCTGPQPVLWGLPRQRVLHAGANVVLLRPPTVTCAMFQFECCVKHVEHGHGSNARCVQQAQVFHFCQSAFLFFYGHGSGKAAISVRIDRQRQLILVLRFDTNGCGPILLRPMNPPFYLRLKTNYPPGHRPIRQSRGEPTVLSECENEEPRCFYHGHFSWALWPQRARAPDGSITYAFRSSSTVAFSCMCSVIWELFSHTGVTCVNVIY